nr:unknown [Haemonchus contortus]
MAFSATTALLFSLVGILYLGQLQALPIPGNDAEVALFSTTELASTNTTAIDTLTESESSLRVKRQGGGCGCGSAAVPAVEPVAAQGVVPVADHVAAAAEVEVAVADADAAVAANLKIKLADKIEREQRAALLALPVSFEQSVQPAQTEELVQPAQPETPVQPNQPAQPEQPTQPVVPAQPEDSKDLIEFPFSKPDENIPTEWPQPVFELVTETYA